MLHRAGVIELPPGRLPHTSAPMLGAKKNAQSSHWAFSVNSLTMSYFHTGIRTIIGAEAFHCPVRDGKEWVRLAMVIRLNFLLYCIDQQIVNS